MGSLSTNRDKSRMTISADSLKNFRKFGVGDRIKGNFSGKITSLDVTDYGPGAEEKQHISLELTTIFVEGKFGSESKNKSMDKAYSKARKSGRNP